MYYKLKIGDIITEDTYYKLQGFWYSSVRSSPNVVENASMFNCIIGKDSPTDVGKIYDHRYVAMWKKKTTPKGNKLL